MQQLQDRSIWIIVAALAIIKAAIQFAGNRNYGFHRDELLHLSVSEHLAWGYPEFPPFISWMGRISDLLFNYSLMGVRSFPTLAGVAILILCCLMAKEMKANRTGIILAGICALGFLPFYRNHTLFQPVSFDQLFWTLGFYFLIKYANTDRSKYLLITGIILGFGFLNKYTMLVWAFGVFIGLVLTAQRKVFRSRKFYVTIGLTLVLMSPNIIWQWQNGWPLLLHLSELRESQLQELNFWAFGLDQLQFPIVLAISIIGIIFLYQKIRYQFLAVAAATIFLTMWFLNAKSYYFFACYPLLFAAGSTWISQQIVGMWKGWPFVIVISIFSASLPFIPHLTPIFTIERYVAYAGLDERDGRVELTGDYADMFGWTEQVQAVDSVYRSLTPAERSRCVIWAENYGEAGALKILGKVYDLPNPISRHGSFWGWGYGDPKASVWISIGNEAESVHHVFEEVRLVKIIRHKYAIAEEHGIPLYLCRKPKLDIARWWLDYEPYIFN